MKRQRSKNGFSLIDLMVALGVLGVLALVVSFFAQNVFTTFLKMDKTKSIADTVELARATLSREQQCSQNLTDLPFSSTSPVEVQTLGLFSKTTPPTSSLIAKKSQMLSGVVIASMVLRPKATIESNLIAADFEITFRDTGINPAQSALTVRTIPITVRTQNSKILACWVRKDTAEAENDQVCMALTDGTMPHYDEATGKCYLEGGIWVDGTSSRATCAGYALPPKPGCRVEPPEGFKNDPPANAVEATFSDGSSGALFRAPWIVNYNAAVQRCDCDVAADIPNASEFKCQILCIKP